MLLSAKIWKNYSFLFCVPDLKNNIKKTNEKLAVKKLAKAIQKYHYYYHRVLLA